MLLRYNIETKLLSNIFKAFHKGFLEHTSEMLACSELSAVSGLLR